MLPMFVGKVLASALRQVRRALATAGIGRFGSQGDPW
jgi:hypothetical protein